MGRAPCCDKTNVKKGPWSPEEDAKLKSYIEEHGTGGNWIALPQKIGLRRCGKSCRLRWLNYLRPNIKHGGFSEEEENIICSLYLSIGSRWSIIAAQLPGRTDNDIKNYWNTRLKKKLLGKQRKEQARQTISCDKQEMIMKKDSESFVVSEGIMNPNPIPYWPDFPLPISAENLSQEDDHKDRASSIRKLPVSLGGRFLHDHHQQPNLINTTNLQYHSDISPTKAQLPCGNSINAFAASTSLNSTDVDCSQLPNTDNYDSVNGGPNMYQEFNHHPIVELGDQMVYNTPQQLDGLDCFSGLDMVNCSSGTSSAESNIWVDHINSLLYPPMVSIFEASQKSRTFEGKESEIM